MSRETFWNGFYIYIIVQGTVIVGKLVELFEISWWFILFPTILIFLGGLAFAVYFGLTCNPRIERDIDIEVTK
jgi:hypothetical protein